jgi:hypothetical protein
MTSDGDTEEHTRSSGGRNPLQMDLFDEEGDDQG